MSLHRSMKLHNKITSEVEFGKQMKYIAAFFAQKETEDTWEEFSTAFKSISYWIREDHVTDYETFSEHVKDLKLAINRSLCSHRTRLSSAASALIKDMAESMTIGYCKLNSLFSQTIIAQFSRTNKTHTKYILEDYKAVIKAAKLPSLIPTYCDTLTNRIKHKNNANLRTCISDCLCDLIQVNSPANVSKHRAIIEKTIQTAALDSNASVRAMVRRCYHAYGEKLPDAVLIFEKKLSTEQLKYLHQSPSPLPSPSTSNVKKVSRTSMATVSKSVKMTNSRSTATIATKSILNKNTTIKKTTCNTTTRKPVSNTTINKSTSNTTISKPDRNQTITKPVNNNKPSTSSTSKEFKAIVCAYESKPNSSDNISTNNDANTLNMPTNKPSNKSKFSKIAKESVIIRKPIGKTKIPNNITSNNTQVLKRKGISSKFIKNKVLAVSKLVKNKRAVVSGLTSKTKISPMIEQTKKRTCDEAFGNDENKKSDKRSRS